MSVYRTAAPGARPPCPCREPGWRPWHAHTKACREHFYEMHAELFALILSHAKKEEP